MVGIVLAAPSCFSSRDTAVSPAASSPTVRILIKISPTTHSHTCAHLSRPIRCCCTSSSVRPATHSSSAPLPSNRTSPHPAAAHVGSSASIAHEPDHDLLSADFLCCLPPCTTLSLNCHCADASFTMYATLDASSSLPLLSFVAPFVVSTHLHDSSESSNQRFNLMPRLPLSSDGLPDSVHLAFASFLLVPTWSPPAATNTSIPRVASFRELFSTLLPLAVFE